jgi:hypothetical protein
VLQHWPRRMRGANPPVPAITNLSQTSKNVGRKGKVEAFGVGGSPVT